MKPVILNKLNEKIDKVIIIGTLENSPVIKEMMAKGKLDTEGVSGKWESFCFRQ